jgi:prepilin-type N-terminal cleavage/methylation domain-containing protein
MRHKKKYIRRNNEKGFTLVEVMVSIGILSFGLLAVAAMQNSALLGTAKSKAVTEATTVAMDRMEQLWAMPFDTFTASYPAGTYSDPAPPSNIISVKWDISDAPPLPSDSAKKIKVTVQSRSMKKPIILENIKLKIS